MSFAVTKKINLFLRENEFGFTFWGASDKSFGLFDNLFGGNGISVVEKELKVFHSGERHEWPTRANDVGGDDKEKIAGLVEENVVEKNQPIRFGEHLREHCRH